MKLKQNNLQMVQPRRKFQSTLHRRIQQIFGNRVKGHNRHTTSGINKHSISNNHTQNNICHFKIIDHDSKQDAREARESIQIQINNAAHNCNVDKIYISETFNHLLGADRSSSESNQVIDSDLPQGCTHLTIPIIRFSRIVCLTNYIA